MSRNRRLLINEIEKTVRLLLFSPATNVKIERIISALKLVKTWLRSTVGNKRLHTLMLMHVHNSILDNINLVDVPNELVDKTDSRKQTFGNFYRNYS